VEKMGIIKSKAHTYCVFRILQTSLVLEGQSIWMEFRSSKCLQRWKTMFDRFV